MKSKNLILGLIIGTGLIASTGCNESDRNKINDTVSARAPTETPPGGAATGATIDRLARPALNEGLSINDATLNAFNNAPPSVHLSDAAKPVRDEAVATLTAFKKLGAALGTTAAPDPAVTAGAFLPDVMRIDTRLDIPPGKTAYNAATSGDKGMLTGGRKLEDDVMDITLSFLVAGDATGKSVKDGVSYAGSGGNMNQGHKFLNGQFSRGGQAQFPFVATPN